MLTVHAQLIVTDHGDRWLYNVEDLGNWVVVDPSGGEAVLLDDYELYEYLAETGVHDRQSNWTALESFTVHERCECGEPIDDLWVLVYDTVTEKVFCSDFCRSHASDAHYLDLFDLNDFGGE